MDGNQKTSKLKFHFYTMYKKSNIYRITDVYMGRVYTLYKKYIPFYKVLQIELIPTVKNILLKLTTPIVNNFKYFYKIRYKC